MDALRQHLSQLGRLVSQAIIEGTTALTTHDVVLARAVSVADVELNRARFVIEETTYEMLERGNLRDDEVRTVVSVVMVGHALEHIGDCAANLAHLAVRFDSTANNAPPVLSESLQEMAATAADMVRASVSAFVTGDARLAETTVRRDRDLNDAYERIPAALLGDVPAERKLLMLWAAHNLQQIGAHTAAICERAIFVATGELKEFR